MPQCVVPLKSRERSLDKAVIIETGTASEELSGSSGIGGIDLEAGQKHVTSTSL